MPLPSEIERPWPLRPVGDARLAVLYHELSALLASGVALPAALGLLERHARGRLAEAVGRVRAAAFGGATAAEALAADPAVFPAPVRALVRAGETTGGLPEVLGELAATMEQRIGTRRRLLRAAVYPLLLFSLSFFILPLSRIVTGGVGSYLRASVLPWAGAMLGLAALFLLGPLGVRAALGPERAGRVARGLPLYGTLVTLRLRAAFARQLSAALRAGLEVMTALRLAAEATGDPDVPPHLERACERVRGGATLEEALARSGLFDESFLMAVAGGETSGRLEASLARHARQLEEALLHRLEVLLQVGAVLALLAVYAFAGWRMYLEYRQLLGGSQEEIETLMKQLESGGIEFPQ